MRTLALIVLTVSFFGSCGAQNSTASTGEASPVWLVASDLANPPFAWVDDEGVAQGRDVEMAQALARKMNLKLEWKRMEFDVLLDTLEAGEVDAVIATLGATPERARRVLLSEPYYVTALSVVVRRGEGEPTRLRDLHGRTVSAGIGTTSEKAIRERLPEVIVAEPSAKGSSSLERLLSGEVDAFVMDKPDADDYVAEFPEKLFALDEPLAAEHYVVAIRPNADDLLERINAALEQMRARGELLDLDQQFELEPGSGLSPN